MSEYVDYKAAEGQMDDLLCRRRKVLVSSVLLTYQTKYY